MEEEMEEEIQLNERKYSLEEEMKEENSIRFKPYVNERKYRLREEMEEEKFNTIQK